MKVKFKNNESLFSCSEPIEQKLFKSGSPSGWLIMFTIYADVTADEIDGEIVTVDSISELLFINSAENQKTISGYNKISSCTIRHNDTTTAVELQFTKQGV